jgi:crotonyl-CoA reductase
MDGKVVPPLSAVYPLEEVGEAANDVHHNRHEGKIGVLCVAEREGLGISNPELRAKVGEDRLTIFRRHDKD